MLGSEGSGSSPSSGCSSLVPFEMFKCRLASRSTTSIVKVIRNMEVKYAGLMPPNSDDVGLQQVARSDR